MYTLVWAEHMQGHALSPVEATCMCWMVPAPALLACEEAGNADELSGYAGEGRGWGGTSFTGC